MSDKPAKKTAAKKTAAPKPDKEPVGAAGPIEEILHAPTDGPNPTEQEGPLDNSVADPDHEQQVQEILDPEEPEVTEDGRELVQPVVGTPVSGPVLVTCPECKTLQVLTSDGVGEHNVPPTQETCDGSGKTPKRAVLVTCPECGTLQVLTSDGVGEHNVPPSQDKCDGSGKTPVVDDTEEV